MRVQLLTLTALAAGASAQMMNLTALLGSTPELSNLTTYVSLFPDLVKALGSTPNLTILAPSNDAFAKFLNTSMIDPSNTELIKAVLQYHVLNGSFPASSVKSTPAFIPTLLDNPTYENVTGGQVVEAVAMDGSVIFFSGLLMNSTVTKADVNYTNGIVHIIDSVLTLPPNISTTTVAANLTSLAGALTAAKLVAAVDSLSDVTVFAPSNAAFQAIGSALPNLTMAQITSILTYHVVNGTVGYSSDLKNGTMLTTLEGGNVTITIMNGTVFVNDAMVVVPNVLVAGGVVHVIDNVLNPNNTAIPSASATMGAPAFSGASSASAPPFTSGVPTPTSALGGGAAGGMASTSAPAASGGGGASSSTSGGAAVPMRTGAVGAAALFGGAALVYNM